MNIVIINNHSKHLPALVNFMNKIGEATVVPKEGLDLRAVGGFDLVVLSGGFMIPSIQDHPEEYEIEIEIIKRSKVPVIGICLGFEIIAKGYGGSIDNLYEKQEGIYSIELNGETKEICEHHKKCVRDLPSSEFLILAKRCTKRSEEIIEIAKHKKRPLIGFQFHPELHNEEFWANYIEAWYEEVHNYN